MQSASHEQRYAIYYAPAAETALWRLGSTWLGRDAASGCQLAQPRIAGFTAQRLREIAADAGHYGFHATLKPPFVLAPGRTLAELAARVETFAATRVGFRVPRLVLAVLGGFIALVLERPSPGFQALADASVEAFDDFRHPPRAGETERRRRAGLTPRQDRLLGRWGYPYVFEEWQFHMTLTCRLDKEERDRLLPGLSRYLQPALAAAPWLADSVCLFRQDGRTAPFRLSARFPFGM